MVSTIKIAIRKIVRYSLGLRDDETVLDGVNRYFYKLKRFMNKDSISIEEMEAYFREIGIKNEDTLIVHCAWRGCFSLSFSPEKLISLLLDMVGENGTLLMPCYGHDITFLDVNKTPSSAGVLSEIFRKNDGVIRSEFPEGTMCGFGKNSKAILTKHKYSRYAFDENSPYYIASEQYNAKVLLLGMGKKSHKITIFHCGTYKSRENASYYKKVFSKKVDGIVIDSNENKINLEYLTRRDGCSNNKRVFKRIFGTVKKNTLCKKKLVMTLFDAHQAYECAIDYCNENGEFYKG